MPLRSDLAGQSARRKEGKSRAFGSVTYTLLSLGVQMELSAKQLGRRTVVRSSNLWLLLVLTGATGAVLTNVDTGTGFPGAWTLRASSL
jgi:hypothetical protein